MHKHTFVLSLFGLTTAAALTGVACSDDEKNDGTQSGDGGAGSETGTTDSGGGGVDSGGFITDSGQSDAGQCTSSAVVSAKFDPGCASCLLETCCAELKACESNPDCITFMQCLSACVLDGGTGAGSSCESTCQAGIDAGAALGALVNGVVLCGGKSVCHNDGGGIANGVKQCPF